jgi:hypothetical protein
MAETAMVNGKFPPNQVAFNNFAAGYLDQIWGSIHGVEGGGYLYGGLKPGDWNDGAHGTVTISKTNPDLEYVHVLTKPATATSITLGDNAYRVTRVTNFRTGEVLPFTQHDGQLTFSGIAAWDTYDTVFKVETAGRYGSYPTGVVSATASASADGFPARYLTDGDYLSYWDSNTTLPVSVTLDLGARRKVAYLAVNQREWSPTYNRNTFGRPEDSARIKNYKVYASNDGKTWGDPIKVDVMPSARGVQFIELNLADRPVRYVKLEVDDTWALANAPRFYQKLQIDEMWAGFAHPTSALPIAPTTTIEAESGTVGGYARVAPCATCSGGAKVENLGNDGSNDLTLTVRPPSGGGDYLLTVVGAVAGTRTVYVSVNGGPAQPLVITDSSFTSPLVARTLQVRLLGRANTIRLFNGTAYAPDIDKIQLSALHLEDD